MSTTFSLLQISLDQTIERDFFVDAARATESVTRQDLMQLYRDLYGIAASHLSHADAVALQREWARLNFPTEIVADEALPLLPDLLGMQRVNVEGDSLRFTSMMGATSVRLLSEVVFIGGGHLKAAKMTSEEHVVPGGKSENRVTNDYYRTSKMEDVAQFRIEFFFWSEPNRVTLVLGPERIIFFNDRALQVHKKPLLEEVAVELRKLMPPERMSAGLLDSRKSYPSVRAYLEEIRWHFYRLIKAG